MAKQDTMMVSGLVWKPVPDGERNEWVTTHKGWRIRVYRTDGDIWYYQIEERKPTEAKLCGSSLASVQSKLTATMRTAVQKMAEQFKTGDTVTHSVMGDGLVAEVIDLGPEGVMAWVQFSCGSEFVDVCDLTLKNSIVYVVLETGQDSPIAICKTYESAVEKIPTDRAVEKMEFKTRKSHRDVVAEFMMSPVSEGVNPKRYYIVLWLMD